MCIMHSGLTPIHPDGCMIVVWTEGVGKKFRAAAEIASDAKRKQKKIDAKPRQYFCIFLRVSW